MPYRYIIACLFFFFPAISEGQIALDTVRGVIGKGVAMPLLYDGLATIEGGETIRVEGSITLSDPTVFFPERFFPSSATSVIDSLSGFTRFTDSTYSFNVELVLERQVANGDTLTYLAGEALAGADSICFLRLSDITLDQAPVPDVVGKFITESIGPQLPYVRPATLEPGYPNPTQPGRTVTWGYRIDKESDVKFIFYDVLGQEVAIQDLGLQDNGIYINTFTPDFTFPSGMFIVRLITNSGEAYQSMHVLR